MRTCGPRGPVDSPFVIVGEAPGKHEIVQNKPFVGPSGQVLDFALDAKATHDTRGHTINWVYPGDYPEPYITNTYKQLITSEKSPDFLSKLAIEARPALLEEIGKYPRRIILASGSVALQALTGDTSLKITKVRGQLFPSPLAEIGILACVHPAFLLRGGGSLRQFRADISYAIELAAGGEPKPWTPPTWSWVQSKEELDFHIERMHQMSPEDIVACDIETTGLSHISNRILTHGFSLDGKHVYIINCGKTGATAPNLLEHIAPMWETPSRKVWHNGKFDIKFFWHIGQTQATCDEDTMLMSYALDEMRGIHGLEIVASDYLGSPDWKGVLGQYLPNKKTSYDVIPPDVLGKYQAYDIANTFNLAIKLGNLIAKDPIATKQYARSLMPASNYLADIEMNGMPVDEERVSQNRDYYAAQAAPHIKAIMAIAKAMQEQYPHFQYTEKLCNSPKQLAELIFDIMKLRPINPKHPNVRGTGDDILEKLRDNTEYPLIKHLRQYRKIAKAMGTYVKPYTRDPEDGCIEPDGKIHASYLIHGTATGRLSSRDPNLQNVPRDPQIRGQFVARPGRMFIEPDLNQAELRSLAVLSGDVELCRIYTDGAISLHEKVRGEIFGHPEEWSYPEIDRYLAKFFLTPETRYDPTTKEDRIVAEQKMRAKNVNFGIVYGITKAGLAEQTGESPIECGHWLETWAKTFPEAWDFIQRCRMAPMYGKNLVTVFGYRKRFQLVSPERIVELQNEAANFPHQNTASLITMHAGIRTYKKLRDYDAYYINTVHDSLLIDAPLDYEAATAITNLVVEEAQQVPKDWGLTRIPFVADAKWGTRWGSLGSPKKFAISQGWEA